MTITATTHRPFIEEVRNRKLLLPDYLLLLSLLSGLNSGFYLSIHFYEIVIAI